MLRATPLKGRTFTEAEGELGDERKVVLSHRLWQRLFGGRNTAIGQDLRINGNPYQVIGVMAPDFLFLNDEVELWVPLAFNPQQRGDDRRHNNSWTMIGLLKPGSTVEQAQQQVDALNARNLERFTAMKEILVNAGFHTVVTSLQEDIVRDVRRTLYLLWGGVLFVLAIGAVNITNLVLVRSSARMRELATRHALGAGLSRLTRQLLTETILLTVGGGLAGIGLGYGGLVLLSTFAADALPRSAEIRMDAVVVAFTIGLAVLVGVLVALVPVVSLRQMNLSQAFREEGRSGTTGGGARRLRQALVASQVAFAFMLLIGGGLLLASFERVLRVDPGFDPSQLLTARLSPPGSRYGDDSKVRSLAQRFLEAVRTVPGVQSAGMTSNIPFGGDFSDSVILAEGYQMAPGESLVSPYQVIATPGYMETLKIPLRSGRYFADSDTSAAPRVVIVDEALAKKFWPGLDPVGRRMYLPDSIDDMTRPPANPAWLTVVGVVGETRMAGLVTSDTRVGTYYFPIGQDGMRNMTLAVRTAGDPLMVTGALRQALATIDPELPLYSVRTMDQRIGESLTDRRMPMMLAVMFAGIALFLAAMGLYGVLAYQVAQRRKEIAIRMALGSEPSGIFSLVLREGVGLLMAGLVVGLAGAFAIRRAIETQLYGVTGMEPAVLAGVAALLTVVATLACAVPAHRAARIDPMGALGE